MLNRFADVVSTYEDGIPTIETVAARLQKLLPHPDKSMWSNYMSRQEVNHA